MKGIFWTEELTARLKTLHAGGLSSSQMAAEMNCGISRNAVCGKIHRLGWNIDRPPNPGPSFDEREFLRRVRSEKQMERQRIRRRRQSAFRYENPRPVRPLVCEAIEPRHVDLLDLGPNDCRWAYGEGPYTFCGASKFHGSYCTTHYFASTGPGTSSERAATKVSGRALA